MLENRGTQGSEGSPFIAYSKLEYNSYNLDTEFISRKSNRKKI